MSFSSERYRNIKNILDRNRKVAQRAKESHPLYNVDRRNASEYLSVYPRFQKIIRAYFLDRRQSGLPIIYADICGNAKATSMGATHNYNFSIKESYSKLPGTTEFKGDIFNKRDVISFLDMIRNNGHKLNYVTFEPIVGLQSYRGTSPGEDKELHRKVVWQQLENVLVLLLDAIEPGGYIYISKPFQIDGDLGAFLDGKKQNQYEEAIEMKRFARKNRLRIKNRPLSLRPGLPSSKTKP